MPRQHAGTIVKISVRKLGKISWNLANLFLGIYSSRSADIVEHLHLRERGFKMPHHSAQKFPMNIFGLRAICARMGHRADSEHKILTLEAPTHTGVLEHCSVGGMY